MKSKQLAAALLVLAAVLIGLHLHVPRGTRVWLMTEPAASARKGETMTVEMPQGGVDVNAASAGKLTDLTGVGPALAQEIIAERETNGDFYYPEDLINVKGIGEKTLEKMRDQLLLPWLR